MKMKRIICTLLATVLLVSSCFICEASFVLPENVDIAFRVGDSILSINGNLVEVETPFIAGYGTTLVPLRVITEAFGAIVTWDGEERSITLDYPKTDVYLKINDKEAKVNGEKVELAEAPVLTENGVTMVPLRFLSETYGADVAYDDETRAIHVIKSTIRPESKETMNEYKDYISVGSGLHNTFVKLTKDKSLDVCWFGGSVTAATTWGKKWFTENFPDAEINFFNASVGASGSRFGAYRVERDVISQNPDLVFIEYAINDKYCSETSENTSKYYEYIIRKIKTELPKADIIAVFVTDKDLHGRDSVQLTAQQKVCRYYNIPSVNVGKYFASTLSDVDSEWSKYYSDTAHPKPTGYAILEKPIDELLHNCLLCDSGALVTENAGLKDASFGADTLELTYVSAADMDPKNVTGWKLNESGKFISLERTPHISSYSTENANNSLEFVFYGTDCGLVTNYPGGTVYVSTDGRSETKISLQNAPFMICKDLAYGRHKIVLRADHYFSFGGIIYKK